MKLCTSQRTLAHVSVSNTQKGKGNPTKLTPSFPPRTMSNIGNNPASAFLDATSHLHGVFKDVSSAVEEYSKSSMEAFQNAAQETQEMFHKSASAEEETAALNAELNRKLSTDSTESPSSWFMSECDSNGSRAREIKQMRRELRQIRKSQAEGIKYRPDSRQETSTWKPMSKADEFKKLVKHAREGGAIEATKVRAKESMERAFNPIRNRDLHPEDFAAQVMTVKRGHEQRVFFRGQYMRDQSERV
eukprot:854909-Rhodomonas_salina.2